MVNEIFSLILCLILLAVCIYVSGFEASVLVLFLRVDVLVLVLISRVAVLLTSLLLSQGRPVNEIS